MKAYKTQTLTCYSIKNFPVFLEMVIYILGGKKNEKSGYLRKNTAELRILVFKLDHQGHN